MTTLRLSSRPESLARRGALTAATLALVACGSPAPPSDTGANDASIDDVAIADSQTPVDSQGTDVPAATDAPMTDGGALTVTCAYDTPFVIVAQSTGAGPATTVLRLPLQFSGAASGITLTSVTQLESGTPSTTVRTWDVASIHGPAGFTGTATPMSGYPNPVVRFTATAPSVNLETTACSQRPWQRPAGTLHVVGSTTEGGHFEVDCSLGLNYGGRGPEPLRFACAHGVPGWLGGGGSQSPSIGSVTTPIVALLASSGIHAHNIGTADATGFTALGATLSAHVSTVLPPGVTCPTTDPPAWTLGTGMHTLWNGSSSANVWSGPVAPGSEADANWMFQQNGVGTMSGYCAPPSTGTMDCPPPVIQVVLTGTSSAGPFEWESDLFQCLLLH